MQHAICRTPCSLKKPRLQFNSFFLIIFIMLLSAASYSNATEGIFENNISIEGWETSHGTEIPILRFDTNLVANPILNDIKPENMIQDENGSVRFQLSHTTAFGRRVFANVTATDLGNGTSINTMTNIADGKQTTFISHNNELPAGAKALSLGDLSVRTLQSKTGDDESIQFVVAAIVTAALVCAATIANTTRNCSNLCGPGGVDSLVYGICGRNPVCTCNNGDVMR